ncbi:hypothetical protein HJG60_011164 [Phyllostomus discolor]|uniref:Uncharacterized protein n=1 Tax=Phyllostomus discolor TaxID=89673 RepID=A0A834A3Z1_9CHIR|nr:hypothetical protein HJG60_011164 [Phyllostomus discolor]
MVVVKFAAFSNFVGLCFVAVDARASSLGEMLCACERWGRGCCGSGGQPELGGGCGCGVSEDSRKTVTPEVSMKAPPTLEGTLFRELLTAHGAHLGNRHPFVDLEGSPGARPALQWNIWKALAPPHGRTSEPWRQINDLFLAAP